MRPVVEYNKITALGQRLNLFSIVIIFVSLSLRECCACAQFHRVYSPITFGKKYDKQGKYIRHFLPVLKARPMLTKNILPLEDGCINSHKHGVFVWHMLGRKLDEGAACGIKARSGRFRIGVCRLHLCCAVKAV